MIKRLITAFRVIGQALNNASHAVACEDHAHHHVSIELTRADRRYFWLIGFADGIAQAMRGLRAPASVDAPMGPEEGQRVEFEVCGDLTRSLLISVYQENKQGEEIVVVSSLNHLEAAAVSQGLTILGATGVLGITKANSDNFIRCTRAMTIPSSVFKQPLPGLSPSR